MKIIKGAISGLRGLLATIALCLSVSAQAQYAYDITPLGGYIPAGINNKGQVVGSYTSTQYPNGQAFEYSNGQTTDLFPTNTSGVSAVGINDKGQITGTDPISGPYVYNSGTGVTQSVGKPQPRPGIDNNYAYAINQNGDVAGRYFYNSFFLHAFIYSSNTGQFQDINQTSGLSGAAETTAINNVGQAAGDVTAAGRTTDAFLYSNGVAQDIGTLPGGGSAIPTGINDSGDVAGYSDGTGFSSHAFLYHNGSMQDIGVKFGSFSSFADGINNAGDVVGEAGSTGFLYHNGTPMYLNNLIDPSLGWQIQEGVAINNNGQIIGFGNLGGFIMTPHVAATPAPGSLLTFGAGIGAMLLAARRRKRRVPA